MAQKIATLYAEVGADTSKLQKGMKDAKTGLAGFGGQLNDTVKGLTGFNLSTLTVAGGVVAIGNALKQTVDETQNYNLSMVDLAQKMGTTTEEASKLVQVADDLRIGQEQLTTSMQFMAKNGFDPSIDGLAKLADEYVALKTPAEKMAMLMKDFGRSGADMGRLLQNGGDGIKKMAAEVDKGLIVTKQAAEASEEYYKNVDNLNDSFSALKFTIGNAFIPLLNDIIDGENSLTEATWDNVDALERGAALMEQYGQDATTTKDRIADMKREIGWAADAARWQGVADAYQAEQEKIQAASGQTEKSIGGAVGAMKNLTKETLFNMAAANLDYEAALDLAEAMGIVDEDSRTAYDAMELLTDSFNSGKITAEQYRRYVLGLGDSLDSIDGRTANMVINIITHGRIPKVGGQGGVTVMGNTTVGGAGTSSGQSYTGSNQAPGVFWGNATGADFIVPPGYNDTYPVKVKSGEHVKVTPAGQPNDSGVQLAAILSALNSLDKRIGRSVRDALAGAA